MSQGNEHSGYIRNAEKMSGRAISLSNFAASHFLEHILLEYKCLPYGKTGNILGENKFRGVKMKAARYISRMSFRVDPELREKVEQKALDCGISFGDAARRALNKGLEDSE